MKNNGLYVRVDRIQSHEPSHLIRRSSGSYKASPREWHANGKSSKDVYLEQKAKADALRLEFRL